MLQNQYGERKTSPEVHGELDVEVGRLLGLKAGKFQAHWLDEFDYQYSIIGVIDRRVTAYAHFDFRELDLKGGNYGGSIHCLVSRGLSDEEMSEFFLATIEKYKSIIRQLASMRPEGIDLPLELPWIVLRLGQRRWAKTVKRHGWTTDEPRGEYMESSFMGEGVTVHYEPPGNSTFL